MNFNWTAPIAGCVLNCFQPPFNTYFEKHYYQSSWPTSRFLLTVNLVGLLGATVLVGMNCCCPCSPCKRKVTTEMEPLINHDSEVADSQAPATLPRATPNKVAYYAKMTLLTTATTIAATAGIAGLVWTSLHDKATPLSFVEGLIQGCYTNCTG